MTECIMYNIVLGEFHPSTICVERSKFNDSLKDIISLTDVETSTESLQEYITNYARTDEIKPDDKTIGFVVFNLQKRVLSISLASLDLETSAVISSLKDQIQEFGFNVELDLPE